MKEYNKTTLGRIWREYGYALPSSLKILIPAKINKVDEDLLKEVPFHVQILNALGGNAGAIYLENDHPVYMVREWIQATEKSINQLKLGDVITYPSDGALKTQMMRDMEAFEIEDLIQNGTEFFIN